jgi:hypothetical protein
MAFISVSAAISSRYLGSLNIKAVKGHKGNISEEPFRLPYAFQKDTGGCITREGKTHLSPRRYTFIFIFAVFVFMEPFFQHIYFVLCGFFVIFSAG